MSDTTPVPGKPDVPLSLLEREPIVVRGAITAAVTAILHVAVVYGLLDDEGAQAIGLAIDAVGVVVLLVVTRRGATANAKVVTRVTTGGLVVAGDAATVPTGSVVPITTDAAGEPVATAVPVIPGLVNPAA